MALEDIFNALEEQARADCDQILRTAREQAAFIGTDCEADCEAIRRRHVDQREREVRAQVAQGINAARLEAKKKVAAVKEQAVSTAFEDARAALAKVRSNGEYVGLLKMLLEEATAGVEGPFEVRVDSADVALATDALGMLGLSAEVRGDLSTAGGVVVTTEGGRISRRNTLEDRLNKIRQSSQAQVAEILFS